MTTTKETETETQEIFEQPVEFQLGSLTGQHEAKRAVGKKILAIMSDIGGYVQKKGRNDFHKYNYVQESDVMDKVSKAMIEHGLVVLPSCLEERTEEKQVGSGKPFILTTAKLAYEWIDTDTGLSLIAHMIGQGSDNQDKGMYKAITGSEKYMLMKTFMLSSGDDPEKDASNSTHISPHDADQSPNGWEKCALMAYQPQEKLGTGKFTPHRFTFETPDGTRMATTRYDIPGIDMSALPAMIGCDVEVRLERKGNALYVKEMVFPNGAEVYPDASKTSPGELHDTQHDGWLTGTLRAYGQKNGRNSKGSWTSHFIELMTNQGEILKTSTFSLSALSEYDWTPELLDQGSAEQWPVRFIYEQSGDYKNLKALDLISSEVAA